MSLASFNLVTGNLPIIPSPATVIPASRLNRHLGRWMGHSAVAGGIALTAVSAMSATAPGPQPDETTARCAAQDEKLAGTAYGNMVLVHRFAIPEKLDWGKVSVDFSPAEWQVGGADGAPASAAQLRVALRTLGSLEIGGRCTGQVKGLIGYPCGFAVRELGFAGQTGDRYSDIAMNWTPDKARAQAGVTARQAANMKVRVAPLPDTPRFVGLQVDPRHLGNVDKASGRKLEFEIRAVSNPLHPSTFDRASGLMKLCGTGQNLGR
jgi:hypothetical protein